MRIGRNRQAYPTKKEEPKKEISLDGLEGMELIQALRSMGRAEEADTLEYEMAKAHMSEINSTEDIPEAPETEDPYEEPETEEAKEETPVPELSEEATEKVEVTDAAKEPETPVKPVKKGKKQSKKGKK